MDNGDRVAAPFHAGWQASRDCALCVRSARRVSPSQPMYEMKAQRVKMRLVIRVISGKELGTQGDETLGEGSVLLGKQKVMWQERRDLLDMEGLMHAQDSGMRCEQVAQASWGWVSPPLRRGGVDQATVKRGCATDHCADVWRGAQIVESAHGGSWPNAFSVISQAIGCYWNFWMCHALITGLAGFVRFPPSACSDSEGKSSALSLRPIKGAGGTVCGLPAAIDCSAEGRAFAGRPSCLYLVSAKSILHLFLSSQQKAFSFQGFSPVVSVRCTDNAWFVSSTPAAFMKVFFFSRIGIRSSFFTSCSGSLPCS